MANGGPEKGGFGSEDETRVLRDPVAYKIETAVERPEGRVEESPPDTDTTFPWNGNEYTVSIWAAVVGSIIYTDTSEGRDGSSWIGLKVTGVKSGEPPKIESLVPVEIMPKFTAIPYMLQQRETSTLTPKIFQAFLK